MPLATPHELLAALHAGGDVRRLALYWWLAEWVHALEFDQAITSHEFHARDFTHTESVAREIVATHWSGPPRKRLTSTASLPIRVTAVVRYVRRACDHLRIEEAEKLVSGTVPQRTLPQGERIDLLAHAAACRRQHHRRLHSENRPPRARHQPNHPQKQLALLDRHKRAGEALEVTLEEGLQLLGAREMSLEYAPGLPQPWRVRYHAAPPDRRDEPVPYTLHAHGGTWPAALTAALGVKVIEAPTPGRATA